jgi:hypothetical protein
MHHGTFSVGVWSFFDRTAFLIGAYIPHIQIIYYKIKSALRFGERLNLCMNGAFKGERTLPKNRSELMRSALRVPQSYFALRAS